MSRACLETTPGRLSLESFLSQHASSELTLEVGAEDSACRKWFPNLVAINVSADWQIDAQANACQLPFRDGAFGVVICTEVLEHTLTPAAVLNELRRILKPGGKLLLSVPFAFPIHYAPTDYYRFTSFGLIHLLEQWEIASLQETTSDAATLATYFHHWLLKKKGLQWKPPKLVWWGIWKMLTRSYRENGQRATPNGNSHMPAGYVVVAFRSERDQIDVGSNSGN